jgi:pimeloyl-ACP methyl ester carboxylesterase
MSEGGVPTFRWFERGEGEPVLLLHGLMGDMGHWEAVLLALEDVCRPIALALPLFDARLPGVSVPELAEYVGRFMDALELPPAVVGGNSLGGHLALELALTRPERVCGLVLTGSSGLFERGFSRGVPHRPTSAYVRGRMEEIVYDRALVTPEWVERIRGIVTTRELAHRVLRAARAARRHNVRDRLSEIQVPALLVWGREDRITPPEVGVRFHARIPDSELVILSECGHAPMLEQPEPFAAAVRAWLGATRARRERLAPTGELR